MKRICKFIKSNFKVIIAFIIGIIVSGTGVYAATIIFQSNQVGFDNTNSNLTLNNVAVDNVQDAIDAIYKKIPPTCSNSPFQVGDYIDMTPTSTSFTPDRTLTGLDDYDTFKGNAAGTTTVAGTLNPSELNVWRVIRINGDCTVEVVSEYVSSVNVKFAHKTGYMNYIWYLNEIAKQYANTTYTLDPSTAPDGAFRNIGYDKERQTDKITNSSALDSQTLGASGGAGYQTSLPAENLGGGDSGFGTDMALLEDARVNLRAYEPNTTSFTTYWLSSRLFYWGSTSGWYFNARYMNSSGYVNYSYLWYWSVSSFNANNYSNAVRPVITLKSGLTTASGSGTSTSHYTLSAS